MNTDMQSVLELGLAFHGHKCPAMPLGLRAGLAALEALGVQRARNSELVALVELDQDHCATCFGDGVQVATGCTFGKGNIQKLHYGKWGVTLIDKKRGKAVRVVPLAEIMERTKQSEFIALRKKGVPPTQISAEIVDPMVEAVMSAPVDQILKVGPVVDYEWHDGVHTFDTAVCPKCGEFVVERNMRVKDGQAMCLPCASQA